MVVPGSVTYGFRRSAARQCEGTYTIRPSGDRNMTRMASHPQFNLATPLRLTVPVDLAFKLIQQIPHSTCRTAALQNWHTSDDGIVVPESVNWLFCWAKTGMGNRAAADEARRVFDRIMPLNFEHYDAAVDHEYARGHRYLSQTHPG